MGVEVLTLLKSRAIKLSKRKSLPPASLHNHSLEDEEVTICIYLKSPMGMRIK
jgi:hypothetical protein